MRISKGAYEARAAGIVLAKCVVDLDGRLCDCAILRGVPGMDEGVLDALDGVRYTPVVFKGQATPVTMVIPIRIRAAAPVAK